MNQNSGSELKFDEGANHNAVRRDIFYVPKKVLCQQHQYNRIEWLDLSRDCQHRLGCNQCERPQNNFIFEYDDVFQKVWLNQTQGNSATYYAQELKKVKDVLFEQMRKINDILQTIHNYYDHGLHQNLLQCLTHPSAELTCQQLLELSTHLSQKVEFQNNQINFLPEISINDLAKLEKLGASIKHLKNCAKQVEKTTPFLERSQIDLNLCEGLENNTYDLLNESQQSLEITAIDFQYHDSYIVLGVIKDQKRNDIQIWDIDEQLNMRNLLNTLQGHQSQIQFLQISWQQLISIDSTSKMIFWSKQGTYRDWKYGREIHAEIQQINCIQYEFCYNYLALGGNSLKLWKLENQDRLNVINLAQSQMILNKDFITCLCFNNKRQKLAAGTKQGKIWIFEEVENVWIIQQETQISQQQVRQIGFISQNDFISFSLGNLWTKWSYFTDTGYDFCSKFVSNMDDGLFVKDKVRMKYPMQITNGIQSLIISNLYSFSFSGKYLAIFKDNKIKLYKISQIQ